MANSSFFKNTGTSTQLQGSASASAAAALASEQAALASENAAQTSETNAAASAAAALVSKNAAANSAASVGADAAAAAASAVTSQTAATSSSANAALTSADATQTAADRVQTGLDRIATAADAVQTAADRVQTGLDVTSSSNSAAAALSSRNAAATSETNASASATAAAADAASTAADVISTAADAASTAADALATAADRVQTGIDATSATNSASAASTSASAASASQVSAAASAASAAAVFNDFEDRYYGPHASDSAAQTHVTGLGLTVDQGDLYFNSTANEMRVYDGGSWVAASSAGGASLINYNYTATASQTAFSGSDDNSNTLSYTVDNLIVTRNGVVLEDGTDYTATDGSTITLSVAAAAGDEINVVAFKSFTTADMVSATNGGTFQSNVTVNGTMTATAFSGDGSALTNLPAAGISDVVQDTTPQLGGNLDTNGNDITFGDNDKAIFGAGSDLQIYHDGLNSYVQDTGTGDIIIKGDNVRLQDSAGGNLLVADSNDAVQLYYGYNQKLATTASGCDITGTVQGDGLVIDGATVLNSNATIDQGSNSGNTLSLDRTGADGTVGFFNSGTQTALISGVSGGGINAYVGAVPSLAMAINASGSVGIGTASPTSGRILDANGQVRFQASSSGRYFDFVNDSAASYLDVSHALNIRTGGASSLTTALTINASGHQTQTGYTAYGTSAIGYVGDAANLFSGSANDFAIRGTSNVTFGIGASEKMRIDSSGRVTMPYQPAFSAYANSAFTGPGIIPFAGTTLNNGGHFNTSNYRFTAPVAGMYFFHYDNNHDTGTTGAGALYADWYKNGSNTSRHRMYTYHTGSSWEQLSGSIIIELQAGDYMQVYLATGHRADGTQYGCFAGHLIG